MGFQDGIFRHTLDAILLADDEARLVDANPAACELTGYDHDELLSLTVPDLARSQDRGATEEAWRQFLAAGRAEGDFTVRRRDGSTRDAAFRAIASVEPGRHLSVLQDVTEQRRAERATAERDEWIDLILEQLPAMLWITDRRLRITFARGGSGLVADLLATGPVPLETAIGDQPAVAEAHRRALAGHAGTCEARLRGRIWHGHLQPLRRRGGAIVGVLGVGLDVTENVRMRDELSDTLRTVHHLERQRRRLAQELRKARDEERRRLARELHDDLGQAVALMAVLARTLERDVPPDLLPRVTELHELAQRTAGTTRRLIGQLRDDEPGDLTLQASLDRLAAEFASRHDVGVEVSVSGAVDDIPVTVAATAYRICREAVTNAVKHAEAQVVSIVARVAEDWLVLVIEDDGRGFVPASSGRRSGRYGLTGMREQAAEAGGILTIESSQGTGTIVRAQLPLDGG